MSELKTAKTESKLSFKEVFYEDEVASEREKIDVLNNLVPSEEYENIQQKIKELKTSDLPKNIKKINNKATMFIYGGVVTPTIIALLYLVSGSIFDFEISRLAVPMVVTLIVLCGMALGSYNLCKFIQQEKDFKTQKNKSLKNYHNQLVNSFFNGNVVGNIEDLSQENWTKINVLENGENETYMIRIKTDDKGLEHIESMKVVKNN